MTIKNPSKAELIEKVGAIFPILPIHTAKIFEEGRDIFVKFTKFSLSKGNTIVFYVSRKKNLIGEAIISETRKMVPSEVLRLYEMRLFIDIKEFQKYASFSEITNKNRIMKEITVFKLEKIKKFKKPLASLFPVTASGCYLTKDMYDKIKKDAN